MPNSRREFLAWTAASGAAASLMMSSRSPAQEPAVTATQDSGPGAGKTILILGGTAFLGPHLVESARDRGHTVTLFNRGKTNPDMFPNLEKVRGNRDGDLEALKGRSWDAVIDTSAYYPRVVRDSAGLLAEHVGQYVLISSVSVYAESAKVGIVETDPVATIEDETIEQVTGETYGPLKALCEQAAEKAMPGRTTVIRPGLIVGPGDPTDRFTYWPVRISRGGEVLSPGNPSDPIQYIDVRDLAEWTIRMIEGNTTGIYNAVGPIGGTTIGGLLYGCKAVAGGDAQFTWVNSAFLAEHNVSPWSDMPVWVPPAGEYAGLGRVSYEKAQAAGLTTRPAAETIRVVLDWFHELPADRQALLGARPGRGISPEREAEVLAAWHEHQAASSTGS